jgi:FRG domain
MPKIQRSAASIDIECETASEFLSLLDPMRGLFASDVYIFRGVSSKQHDLLPSAHLPGARLLTVANETLVGPLPTIHQQCAAEFYSLYRFFEVAARQGLRLPEDSALLRAELENWWARFFANTVASVNGRSWPSHQLFSLIGLAQHYGVPTRALDWTTNTFTAAYFAARPALASTAADQIAVWAFSDFTRLIDYVMDITADRALRVFTVSGADNDNLRAQRGLFMIHQQQMPSEAMAFTPQTYDQLLLESLRHMRGAAYIVRILLAHSEARSVLAHLAHAGVTAGSLYPGLWGAAREYEESQAIRPTSVPAFRADTTVGLWDEIIRLSREVQGA